MKPIILIGAAERTLRDIASFDLLCDNYDSMAIGLDAIDKCEFPINYIASYHDEDFKKIKEKLKTKGFHNYKLIHHKLKDGVDIVEEHLAPSGSSALLGAVAAIRLGYTKIVLCGCPLIGIASTKYDYALFQKGWVHREKEVKPYVKSMSGFIKEKFGEPTIEWINDGK